MFALLVTFFVISESTCSWSVTSPSGLFGSTCTVPTYNGTTGIATPSAECQYNYVCAYDANFCGALVCTTYAAGSIHTNTVGFPCNSNSDCATHYSCATTSAQLSAVGTYLVGKYMTWTQGALPGILYNNTSSNISYAGICYCTPPGGSGSALGAYDANGACCNSHTDCKYNMVNSTGGSLGGNGARNYMCSSSSGMCELVASCHPVTRQCEAPSATASTTQVFFNPSCSSCGNNCGIGTNGIFSTCIPPANTGTGKCCAQETVCSGTGCSWCVDSIVKPVVSNTDCLY